MKVVLVTRIKNLGSVGDIVDVKSGFARNFLLPSKKESFGLSALEAMASKCALVTSNRGGLPELNIENETGFLVDVNDEDKYVEKIMDLSLIHI